MGKPSNKKAKKQRSAPERPPSRWAAHRPLFERLFFVVALLGVLVTAHFQLTASTGFEQECLFGAFDAPAETSDCQAALESPVGQPLGVSNAVWGMLFYLMVAGLCVAVVFGAEIRRLVLKRVRAGLIGVGFLYSAFLTGYQYVAMPVRCPLCLLSALLVTILLGVQLLYLAQPLDRRTMKATRKMREGTLFGALAVVTLLLIGADAAYFNLAEPAAAQATLPTEGLTTRTLTTQPVAAPDDAVGPPTECRYDPDKAPIEDFEALIGEKDPYKGDPDSPVTILEFFDPNCPHCKALHPLMKKVVAQYEDRARFVYKPVTLWQYSIGQNASLWAAAEEGKFFELLDLQFERQQRGGFRIEKIRELAAQVGMDPDVMEQRMRDGQFDDLINGANKQAQAAGVSGVPAVVINGRFVDRESRNERCLGELIETELQSAKAGG